jgi:DNA repair protein RecO (recombination protein O)
VEHYRTEAVTLTARDLGEADKIIEFLTRSHGRISAVARGARKSRKRFGGRLEKFVCVDLYAVERHPGTLARLEEVRVKENFAGLTGDLERIAMAEVLLELTGRFAVPGEEGASGFDDLLAAWRVIQAGELSMAGFFAGLLLVLCRQGVLAPLDLCAVCSEPLKTAAFIPQEGGMVCSACRPGRAGVSVELAGRLSQMGMGLEPEDWSGLAPASVEVELKVLAKTALEWYGGGSLRSLKVWDELLLNR